MSYCEFACARLLVLVTIPEGWIFSLKLYPVVMFYGYIHNESLFIHNVYNYQSWFKQDKMK